MTDLPSCCCGAWVAALARTHARPLAAIARREGLAPADALDAVQDAFGTLIARPDADALRDRPEAAARVLAAIVRNAARNQRRRHHRAKPHVDIESIDVPTSIPPPDEALEHAVAAARFEGCLAGLGDTHRHVITLRVLDELTGDEAARALGLTPGHVAVLLHRARKALEHCMRDDAG